MERAEMSVRRNTRRTGALLLAALSAAGIARAADSPPLPEDFLEYLGSWDANDGDWLVASAAATPTAAQNPVPAAASPARPASGEQSGVKAPATTERKP
jgi:hypothetical protein